MNYAFRLGLVHFMRRDLNGIIFSHDEEGSQGYETLEPHAN